MITNGTQWGEICQEASEEKVITRADAAYGRQLKIMPVL